MNRRLFLTLGTAGLSATGFLYCGPENTSPPVVTPATPASPPGPGSSLPEPEAPPSPPSLECALTGPDIEGPFYRPEAPHRIEIADANEEGSPLWIRGTVYATDCTTPLPDVTVEVWHADTSGQYDNQTTKFRLRGQIRTNEEGQYEYRTILPGRYLNGNQYRPRHIHYKVRCTHQNDLIELTTQLYFEGDEFIHSDPWATPERTIPLFTQDQTQNGVFDIVLPVAV